MKICISNLVYGDSYTIIFLDYHLKSVIENVRSNVVIENSYYLIFTDGKNIDLIKRHPNFQFLQSYFSFNFLVFSENLEYNNRYSYQGIQQQHTAKFCLENELLMLFSVADLYYGPNFFKNAIEKMSLGHDAIVTHAMRVSFESVGSYLKDNSFEDSDTLFDIGFANPHPLWVASNWDSPLFSRIPYHMLWTSEQSILVRGFSLGPLVTKPQDWMLAAGGCTDITYMANLKTPYISQDWHEFPSLELGMLFSFYPPFLNRRASPALVADWASKNIPQENYKNLFHYMIFKKKNSPIEQPLVERSLTIAQEIVDLLHPYHVK